MPDNRPHRNPKSAARRLLEFLWDCKWWWIVPMAVMLLLFGFLLLSSNLTGDSPFVYTLF